MELFPSKFVTEYVNTILISFSWITLILYKSVLFTPYSNTHNNYTNHLRFLNSAENSNHSKIFLHGPCYNIKTLYLIQKNGTVYYYTYLWTVIWHWVWGMKGIDFFLVRIVSWLSSRAELWMWLVWRLLTTEMTH